VSDAQFLMDHGCLIDKQSGHAFFLGLYQAARGEPCRECALRAECPAINMRASRPRGLVLFCPKCSSPINRQKAIRRYNSRSKIESDGAWGLCACGTVVHFPLEVK
jgi:hypothetical protein